MPRTVSEWIGRTDDSMPPQSCFDRLWALQDGKDAITGIPFQAGDRVVRDHIKPLADGGKNRESNLQLITEKTHKGKTSKEATERAVVRKKRAKNRAYVRGPKRGSFATNKDGKWKKKMSGEVVRR